MFRKAKMAIATTVILGSMAVGAPAQAMGWAYMTLYYDDYNNAVGLLVQCRDYGAGGMWGIQTSIGQTEYGLHESCGGWA
jgi:hypothetical protein